MKKIPVGIKLSKTPYTADHLKIVLKENDKITEMRGQIISGALFIEQDLNEVVLKYFFKDGDKKNIFEEFVLEREFFTLMQKWRLLRELLERNLITTPGDKKEVLRLIHDVIEIRDRFAHGTISFEHTTPVIEYLKNGKKKKDALNRKYFNEISIIFNQASDLLEQIQT